MKLNQVKLGSQGLVIPNIGLGCMGMTGFGDAEMYGKTQRKDFKKFQFAVRYISRNKTSIL